jgi:hypothetical protein
VLELADSDPRIVAGAVVGSLAHGPGDEWSDLDLTFAVADGAPVADVLADWTERVLADLDGRRLFDLASGPTIYRVFLLPGCLQVDLSFTPDAEFAPAGPKWRQLFGSAGEPRPRAPRATEEMVGYAVHHAVRAHVSIQRGRHWQAEHWIAQIRKEALALACRRLSLPDAHYRGVDGLPPDVLQRAVAARVASLEPAELRRALRAAVELLLVEAGDDRSAIESRLRELVA